MNKTHKLLTYHCACGLPATFSLKTGRGGGEGSHWSRGHRQGKAQKSSEQPVEADIHQRDVGVKTGEEVVEGSKAAPPSKHQMKKAKKRV